MAASKALSMSEKLRKMREDDSATPVTAEVILSRRDLSKLPSIPNAILPAAYEQARVAISECARIDECKDWADRMAALGSYAKQSHDDSLRKMAERIQARAIRRCGELMQELAPDNRGGRPKKTTDGTDSSFSKKQSKKNLAQRSGLSERQAVTAERVANVPKREFEAAVESPNPPTVTQLAERGKKAAPESNLKHLNGIDPEDFKLSTQAQGNIRRLAEFAAATDAIRVVRGTRINEEREMLDNCVQIARWLRRLCGLLCRNSDILAAELKKAWENEQ